MKGRMIMSKVMDKAIGELYTGSYYFPYFVGLGYLIRYNEFIDETRSIQKEIEDAKCYSFTTTNNRMELLAVIYGLENVIDNITSQKIKLDKINLYIVSKYLYNAVSAGWVYKWKANNWMTSGWGGVNPKPVRNSDLWKELIDCEEKLRQMGVNLLLHFVPQATGAEYRMGCIDKANKLAHEAVGEALDMENKYFEESISKQYEVS